MNASQVELVKLPCVEVVSKETDTNQPPTPTHGKRDNWETGVWKRMPWTGIGALVFVLLASVGQAVVLVVSNGQSAAMWPEYISPNVCLSILNGCESLAIAFAVVQGIAIAWWRQALLGASIKQLHYTWSFSASFLTIFTKLKYFNVIALAALTTKVAIIDGILFQRSIQTHADIGWDASATNRSGVGKENYNVNTWSQTEFPVTGITGSTVESGGQILPSYGRAINSWIATGYGINTGEIVDNCVGAACTYTIPGIGFAFDCVTTNTTDDFLATGNQGNRTMFSIDFAMQYPDVEKNYTRIQMNTTWPYSNRDEESPACPTIFTTSVCELRPSIMKYTMFFVNSSSIDKSKMRQDQAKILPESTSLQDGSQLSFSCIDAIDASWALSSTYIHQEGWYDGCGLYDPTLKQVKGVEVDQPLAVYDTFQPGEEAHLIGIFNAIRDVFKSRAVLTHNVGNWTMAQSGLMADIQSINLPTGDQSCNYTYSDPKQDIISRINLLMARTSTSFELWDLSMYYNETTDTISYNRHLPAQQYFKDVYYNSDFVYMGIGLGLTFVIILCIIPSYWGFWEIGRNVTLGPLEIAYAFQGPAFSDVHGVNGQVEAVVKNVGRNRVQYGEVDDGTGKRLGFKTT